MYALTCHTTHRTAAPAAIRVVRRAFARLAASQTAKDAGFLALAAAIVLIALQLLWVIKTAVFLLAS